jgi:hypothetical protein
MARDSSLGGSGVGSRTSTGALRFQRLWFSKGPPVGHGGAGAPVPVGKGGAGAVPVGKGGAATACWTAAAAASAVMRMRVISAAWGVRRRWGCVGLVGDSGLDLGALGAIVKLKRPADPVNDGTDGGYLYNRGAPYQEDTDCGPSALLLTEGVMRSTVAR